MMLASGCLAASWAAAARRRIVSARRCTSHGVVARQGAVAPVERALAGQDVARGAAAHDADIDRGVVGHGVECGVLALGQLDLQLVQPMDEVAGEVDGADAEMGHRGMGLDAGEGGDDAAAGVLRVDHAHHGGLAHDHRLRPRHVADQPLGQRMRAQAADLLVVAEGEMHRHLEPGALEGRHVGQAAAMKPFMSQVPRP